MENYKIIAIREHPELRMDAANWFHEKWNIPLEAYIESIDECLKNENPVPQWYVAVSDGNPPSSLTCRPAGRMAIPTMEAEGFYSKPPSSLTCRSTGRMAIPTMEAEGFHSKPPSSLTCRPTGRMAIPTMEAEGFHSRIVGGLGVIENDFHDRKDLSPNVCAVYVEEGCRCQGIAGRMLSYVCKDMEEKNISTLYLVTDHISFYERYGWEFLCMVQGEGEEGMSRMYVHRTAN